MWVRVVYSEAKPHEAVAKASVVFVYGSGRVFAACAVDVGPLEGGVGAECL